jgi:hypothetical protein
MLTCSGALHINFYTKKKKINKKSWALWALCHSGSTRRVYEKEGWRAVFRAARNTTPQVQNSRHKNKTQMGKTIF